MREKKMRTVLNAFLQMISAMRQEICTMSRASQLIDCDECIILVDEIRLVHQENIMALEILKRRLEATSLQPPQDI